MASPVMLPLGAHDRTGASAFGSAESAFTRGLGVTARPGERAESVGPLTLLCIVVTPLVFAVGVGGGPAPEVAMPRKHVGMLPQPPTTCVTSGNKRTSTRRSSRSCA